MLVPVIQIPGSVFGVKISVYSFNFKPIDPQNASYLFEMKPIYIVQSKTSLDDLKLILNQQLGSLSRITRP